ncbi:MAG: helix-turn-helix transcriptional regulator [Ruminococcaceae bacterium]|nr:helix-turn-helix transcriptional regulator [Oscillospiraceae bacterium]
MSKEIGNRIKLLRKQKGLKQDQLAAAIGVSPSAVSNYEQGTRVPKDDTLSALVEVLDTTTDYILRGVEPSKASRSTPLFNQEELQQFKNNMRRIILAEPVTFGDSSGTSFRDLSDADFEHLFIAVVNALSDTESKNK